MANQKRLLVVGKPDFYSKSVKIQKWIEGKEIEKVIFVPQKLINFVIKEK